MNDLIKIGNVSKADIAVKINCSVNPNAAILVPNGYVAYCYCNGFCEKINWDTEPTIIQTTKRKYNFFNKKKILSEKINIIVVYLRNINLVTLLDFEGNSAGLFEDNITGFEFITTIAGKMKVKLNDINFVLEEFLKSGNDFLDESMVIPYVNSKSQFIKEKITMEFCNWIKNCENTKSLYNDKNQLIDYLNKKLTSLSDDFVSLIEIISVKVSAENEDEIRNIKNSKKMNEYIKK